MSKKIMILGASILQLPAIKKAKEIFETSECVSIEVQTEDREQVMYFRDKVNEKYFYVEETLNKEEEELDEPE